MKVRPDQSVNDLVMNNHNSPITPNLAASNSIVGPAWSPGNAPTSAAITIAT